MQTDSKLRASTGKQVSTPTITVGTTTGTQNPCTMLRQSSLASTTRFVRLTIDEMDYVTLGFMIRKLIDGPEK